MRSLSSPLSLLGFASLGSIGGALALLLGGALPTASCVGGVGQDPTATVLRAQRIELVGPNGKVQMILSASETGSGILGGSTAEEAQFLLASGAQGPTLFLEDPESAASVALMIHSDPEHGRAGHLATFDTQGRNMVTLGTKEFGGSVMVFYEQQPLGMVAATKSNGGLLGLVGPDGSERYVTSR